MKKIYVVEFTDKKSREEDINGMPFNREIRASSKNDARRKFIKSMGKSYRKNKINIESIYLKY